MSHGRFINERDIADARRVIVLAAKNARLLFGSDSLAVGKTVQSLKLITLLLCELMACSK